MDFKKSKQLLIILAALYWIFAIGIYAIGYPQFRSESVTGSAPAADYIVGEMVDGQTLRQDIPSPAQTLTQLQLYTAAYDQDAPGTLTVSLFDSGNTLLARETVPVSTLSAKDYTTIVFTEPVDTALGETLTLELTTAGCESDHSFTICAGNAQSPAYQLNGSEGFGALCVRLCGSNARSFYLTYWLVVIPAFLALTLYALRCWKGAKQGKNNLLVTVCTVYTRYRFLIKQLVIRDIKVKYKRSSLGIAWSVMSPLLTMSVQYIVFSTVFHSDIPNYPVYLLTGIVFFNFFSEALNLGMMSIYTNAPLIRKVYIPKYIFPVSRVLSSSINFACAMIPLLLVMLLTGTAFRPSLLLLAFDILCYLAFIIGMTLLLSTAMTFFVDTQFLWGVVSMMWQYLTPVFYPESIIPERLLPIYRLNPMYQFITFARTCIIDGISPAPGAYFRCMITAALVLGLGIAVFRKHQNKFVLYL